ncbi:ketopantoate reductase family protein [Actinomarinicola tropica]|uniref:Ketopantoate reductase family protein n=1 Tax=Actinomarinicola tropica TaxID=2789776 RepID=A0A5Q2RLN8_9ACTN|nr:2-dehydropantoate 2-reductase N-terminal domain-containing protein [Actinomarinicola tropica]QGG96394.1 ketopantoate reductase family protein [Actinomarinicola tropica]
MRFVVYGAGAIGGVVGGRLFEHGHDVTLIARGEHLRVIQSVGLRVDSPGGSITLEIPAAASPREVQWHGDEAVLLCVKGQDTVGALDDLRLAAPPSVAIFCLQNGVANEREALRRFAHVHGVTVMAPTGHLEPGAVQAWSDPIAGMFDVGRYPSGVDGADEAFAQACEESRLQSIPRPDIMRWKHAKLLMNLGNAVQALFEGQDGADEVARAARAEGREVFAAAGIDHASAEEDRERRGDVLQIGAIDGLERGGGSTWQSLARGQGTVETDLLNGEITLLGRLHGVATPINERLQRWMAAANAGGAAPGSADLAAFLAEG